MLTRFHGVLIQCLEEIVCQELLQTTRDEGDMLTNQEQYDQDDQEFIDIRHSNNFEHIFTRATTRSGRASKKRDDRDYVYF